MDFVSAIAAKKEEAAAATVAAANARATVRDWGSWEEVGRPLMPLSGTVGLPWGTLGLPRVAVGLPCCCLVVVVW